MEKTIFKQQFNYAEIIPYKDFSNISDKKNIGLNTFDTDETYEECDGSSIFPNNKVKKVIRINEPYASLSIYPKETFKKKNTKFFYSGEPVGIKINAKLLFPNHRVYLTTKDRHIKRHYNRPFSFLSLNTYIRQIDLTDDKLSVRLFYLKKTREFNSVYFIKKWVSIGFSINLKNGDFYSYKTDKKNKIIKKNSFTALKLTLNDFKFFNQKEKIDKLTEYSEYNFQTYKDVTKKIFHDVRDKFHQNFSDDEFMNKLYHVFKDNLNVDVEFKEDFWYYAIIKIFTQKKEIKVPNDFESLLTKWYPTKKYLKRNDNKLIASILDRLGIKSKQTIRLLHLQPKCDILIFKIILQYFGKEDYHKYLGNLNSNIFVSTYKSNRYVGVYHSFGDVNQIICITENDKEKHNILKLLNEFVDNRNDYDTQKFADDLYMKFREIDDHLSMLRRIKQEFPEIDFNATTWESFHEEHMEFSRISNMIYRGYSITYNFDENLVNFIEKPIVSSGKTYFPIILKKDIEYIEEGKHMHHCVGGYCNHDSSVIISVRYGSPNGNERVTCEYNTKSKMVVQERSFCNKKPPDEFIPVLEQLRNRIENYNGSISAKEKIKTQFTKQEMLEKTDVTYNNLLPF